MWILFIEQPLCVDHHGGGGSIWAAEEEWWAQADLCSNPSTFNYKLGDKSHISYLRVSGLLFFFPSFISFLG